MFYHEIHSILDRLIIRYGSALAMRCMQYSNFYELKEIGSSGYGTVYTAKCNTETVVLKGFKSFNGTPELFISEVRNNWQY